VASSFTCRWFNAASGRGGIACVPGKTSRTRLITSATVAGVSKLIAEELQPASSAYRAKNRTDTLAMIDYSPPPDAMPCQILACFGVGLAARSRVTRDVERSCTVAFNVTVRPDRCTVIVSG